MTYMLGTIWLDAPNKLIPARSGDSNIALSGFADLPIRLGETYHDWDSENGIEPYVDADELFYAGRDITLNMLMKGDPTTVYTSLKAIYDLIDAFTTTQELQTPYGIFYNVYVKRISTQPYQNISEVKIEFREPNPVLTYGSIPSTGTATNTIDGIPFESFGLYLASSLDISSSPELKTQEYTKYCIERFKKVKHKEKVLQINGFIIGNDVNDFLDKVFALQQLFSSPDTRKVNLNNRTEIECFAKDGFKITNVYLNSKMVANFSIDLAMVNDKALLVLTAFGGRSILTHSGSIILV